MTFPRRRSARTQAFEYCSFGDDCDMSSECCINSSWFSYLDGGMKLAPCPNGRCYCGKMRGVCINFQAYGEDCQGFKHGAHERYQYKGMSVSAPPDQDLPPVISDYSDDEY